MGLEIGPGDEVITTPYTWGATVSAILAVGATPLFADIDPLTGLLDPAAIEHAVTRRTKAVLVVHIFGRPADMPAIRRIAKRHGLRVIEDGSHAHGATIRDTPVGNFSDAAGFSCMGGKLLATAEAGYLVTPHADVFWKAAMMCQHYGRSGEPGFPAAYTPYVDSLVFTFRVSPLIAQLFPGQFRRLGTQTRARQANAATLHDALAGCTLIELPRERKGFRSACYYMTMNFRPEAAGIKRETFCKALIAEGVGAWPYVPEAIHRWRRLQWRDYNGPVPFWMPALKAAGTDYAATRLPGCDHKIAHAIELLLVGEYRCAPAAMRRIASAFEKVQDNLPALRRYEAQQHARQDTAVVTAAKRAAATYRRRR
jgi:dTDP-4-amino-4,6-dideoxygalactose transaminase